MALDACMIMLISKEIEKMGESRVEKIYQPSADELVFLMHSRVKNYRLIINAGSSCPRINITDSVVENPPKAPMLCMLLRKHLGGSKLTGARTYGFERICELEFDAYDEMGFKSKKYLICELMGRYSNIILTDADKKIIALLKPIDFSVSMQRQLLVGMVYEEPQRQDKLDTEKVDFATLVAHFSSFNGTTRIDKLICSSLMGVAMSTARQIAYKAAGSIDASLENVSIENLCAVTMDIIESVKDGRAKPYLILDESGQAVEFSYTPLGFYGKGYKNIELESFGVLIDSFYSKKGKNERIKQKSGDILKLLTNAQARIIKKLSIQREELGECERADELRQMGDLITAGMHLIKKGDEKAVLVNYYDDKCPTVTVDLDPKLTPSQNAQRYYKRYNKLKTARHILKGQIEIGERELEYLDTVFDSLTRADGEGDLNQIRDELFHSGYASRMKNYSTVKMQAPKIIKYRTSGGYTLLVGKNNTQNDYITTKLADKMDWWFHVKSLPGSHVVMQSNREEPSEKDFTEAAELAAYFSKAEGNNIAVDYTYVKHVKKPAGAKPGYVIYHVNWTAYVTPDEEKIKKMIIK